MTDDTAVLDEDAFGEALIRKTLAMVGEGAASHDLAEALFGGVIVEDLVAYSPAALSKLTSRAWAFLQQRTPGIARIRLEEVAPAGPDDGLAGISVLEIINDDMPFLVDSVLAQLADMGAAMTLVAHPVVAVLRDAQGQLSAYGGPEARRRESFIHIHLERIADETRRAAIVAAVAKTLTDVRLCVQDWRQMTERARAVVADMKDNPPTLPVGEIAEAIQFLEWLLADNFTFLGVRDYAFNAATGTLDPVFETGLGLLRDSDVGVLRQGRECVTVTPAVRRFLEEPKPLVITKSAVMSRVHRRVIMDYVGVKRFDADGRLTGEFRIVGLFTSTAYTQSTRTIPYLRRKIAGVVERAGFDPKGHRGKALANILENYPRDELFQIDDDSLFRFAIAIMQLDGRPRVRVLARIDEFRRFVSAMVFIPRDRYNSTVRLAIGDYLARAYYGQISSYAPFFPEGPNVRVHFIIACDSEEIPAPERSALERAIEDIIRNWTDAFAQALQDSVGAGRAQALMARYGGAFPAGYRDAYTAEAAVADLAALDGVSRQAPLAVKFYPHAAGQTCVGLKIWSHGRPIPLSERVPVLENMGFRVVDERTYEIQVPDDDVKAVWFHDMTLERALDGVGDVAPLRGVLEPCFLAIMSGAAENDGYNALVLAEGLDWRDVALVRTMSRYLRQIQVPFSQDYMWATLCRHHGLARQIVTLFYARFDPYAEAAGRQAHAQAVAADIEAALKNVDSLDEDRILRRFVNAVMAALRTNFFQRGESGEASEEIAIKFSSRAIDGLPAPRPLYEIFVYSPRVEGVHLRFGKVARGGIRWSDRPQDFRTEVLGLVKAQQVKNAVIVPVGAKGGFVPKRLPVGSTRDAVMEEGTAAYKRFIGSLLDITDNVGPAGPIPPRDVVRYDADDPYLVVAADKGTATFSDIANGIARERGFWLDDAFASGGSAGYDHKKMGITARGAWESVKRHFREMDIDVSATPFTVAGVGDMSGDVFGNGMLRERTIRLVAAFDHRDIFIDPDPDPARSFAERERLFNLPRSSWQDYDKSILSEGGGVYSRNHKEIRLSPQAQRLLGLPETSAPGLVIQAILRAEVDLLFFGGIGTYVRASSESDAAVGDRANDAIRVSGASLRCRVIGEGANLGMTQLGRIEAARKGVRLNTDAIDNSAGVNTSDVEVNIKIATATPLRDGRLTLPARDRLLVEMTDDIAHLVLRNNYLQSLAMSLAERRGLEDLGFQARLMQSLESRGLLDRAIEFLPDDMEIAELRRRSQALTRPQLSVLLAYAKLTLCAELVESGIPDDPYLGRELLRYFPSALVETFPDALQQHQLRRDIIATQLANAMINFGGPTLVVRLGDQTGRDAAAIAAAFAAVRDSYALTPFNADIDALDNRIPGALQLSLYGAVQDLLIDRMVWFLRNVDLGGGLAAVVHHYRDGIAAVDAALGEVLDEDAARARDQRRNELIAQGVPPELAWRVASLPPLKLAPDIVLVAAKAQRPVADVAAIYFAVASRFAIGSIVAAARSIPVVDYYDRLALDRALDTIGDAERRISFAVAMAGGSGPGAVDTWIDTRAGKVDRIRTNIREIAASGLTLSKLTVAASLLGDLAES
jgi:glutamate dehydrogenase